MWAYCSLWLQTVASDLFVCRINESMCDFMKALWIVIIMYVSKGKFHTVYQCIVVLKQESRDLKWSGYHFIVWNANTDLKRFRVLYFKHWKLGTKSKLCFSSSGTLALSWFYYPHHHKTISLWDSLKTIHWLQERGLNLLSKYHGGYAMYTCLCTTWHYHLEAERCQRISLLVFATFSSYLCA